MCYRNFYGVWSTEGLPLEVLAAVLNGPVANAYVSTLGGNRYIRAGALKNIPVPEFAETQQKTIALLVQQYVGARDAWLLGVSDTRERCSDLLMSIDAELLKAYGLPPHIERTLLDYFSGHSRLGPVDFTEYFPAAFRPYIPWHLYISEDFKKANANGDLETSTCNLGVSIHQ